MIRARIESTAGRQTSGEFLAARVAHATARRKRSSRFCGACLATVATTILSRNSLPSTLDADRSNAGKSITLGTTWIVFGEMPNATAFRFAVKELATRTDGKRNSHGPHQPLTDSSCRTSFLIAPTAMARWTGATVATYRLT